MIPFVLDLLKQRVIVKRDVPIRKARVWGKGREKERGKEKRRNEKE